MNCNCKVNCEVYKSNCSVDIAVFLMGANFVESDQESRNNILFVFLSNILEMCSKRQKRLSFWKFFG